MSKNPLWSDLLRRMVSTGKSAIFTIGVQGRGDFSAGLILSTRLIENWTSGRILIVDCGLNPEYNVGVLETRGIKYLAVLTAVDLKLKPGTIKIITGEDFSGEMTAPIDNTLLKNLVLYVKEAYKVLAVIIWIQAKRLTGELSPEVSQAIDSIIQVVLQGLTEQKRMSR